MAEPLQGVRGGRRGAQEAFRELYRARQMEERKIKVEVASARPGLGAVVEGLPSPAAMQHMLSTLEKAMARSPGASQLRELTIAEARPLLEEAETERLVTSESVRAPAARARPLPCQPGSAEGPRARPPLDRGGAGAWPPAARWCTCCPMPGEPRSSALTPRGRSTQALLPARLPGMWMLGRDVGRVA